MKTIPTGRDRELRIELTEYKGCPIVAVRQWRMPIRGDRDDMLPTRNGINFRFDDLPAVVEALQDILAGVDDTASDPV